MFPFISRMENLLLQATEIPYLNRNNWTRFEDVVILADTGQKFGFNRLMLASLSPLCKKLLLLLYECPLANLDDIIYISTDYTEKELQTLKNIMLSGQTMSFKPDLASSFEGIGLNLNNVLSSIHQSLMIKNSVNMSRRNKYHDTPFTDFKSNQMDPLKFEPAVPVKKETDDLYGVTEKDPETKIESCNVKGRKSRDLFRIMEIG